MTNKHMLIKAAKQFIAGVDKGIVNYVVTYEHLKKALDTPEDEPSGQTNLWDNPEAVG